MKSGPHPLGWGWILQWTEWGLVGDWCWRPGMETVWTGKVPRPKTDIRIKPNWWCICTLWWLFQCTFLFFRKRESCSSEYLISFYCIFEIRTKMFSRHMFTWKLIWINFLSSINSADSSYCWLALYVGTCCPRVVCPFMFVHFEKTRWEKERNQIRRGELIWNGNVKCCDRKVLKPSKTAKRVEGFLKA